eukprot:TRINITY_DN14028_c0_g1_i1.p1 TRINITY_DN14028_c0_g1~~TRINITY_DN14028_c0_g1_i1.p1  ORF type:complete len:585 (-),score=71.46 TRINITY_DN14028_c0_g1_i1:332-2086(-)
MLLAPNKACFRYSRNSVICSRIKCKNRLVPWSRRLQVSAAINVDPHLLDFFQNVVEQVPLAYERVALPCSQMNCGDMIYRSTLDPALRMEQKGIDPRGVALVVAFIAYLCATPGVLQGFWDTYFVAAYQRKFELKPYTKDDITMGKKLATGGFGTVYKGTLTEDDGEERQVIVKKANEFGEAEVWMNERLSRACPHTCAQFLTFDDTPVQGSKTSPLWLVWLYEGDFTLFDLMTKRDFPYNMEEGLFGEELNLEKGLERKQAVISQILQQILENLKNVHNTGIVHRDIKPQNIIFSTQNSRMKFIDLGAAADLRVGINYVPNEFLLDPRYAPPQNYIMSTQTPRAPPAPIAALLSPVLWQLGAPDRFDMYSVGIIMLQLIFAPLRNDNILIAFRRKLEDFDYSIESWRKFIEKKSSKDYKEGFQLLDMDNGAGWELLCQLMSAEPEDRPSAFAAANHRFIVGNDMISQLQGISNLGRGVTKSLSATIEQQNLSTAQRTAGLTEAELSESLGFADAAPKQRPMITNTVAWWQQRQNEWNKQASQRKKNLKESLVSLKKQAKKTIGENEQKFDLFGWNKKSQFESD